jgi:hypothetical protein
MNRRIAGSLCLVSLVSTGCIVPKDAKPTVGIGTTLATRFVHRGMTLVDNPVLQTRLGAQLPTVSGDTIRVDVEGNIDLRNNTGGAWFPDGHAGRFTQIEALASYARRFGDVELRAGIHNYTLPNGLEFANGERGGTSEVFLLASAEVLEATPYAAIHYDFDEVRGAYYRAGITEGFAIAEGLSLNLDGSLGYSTEAQSSWMYGLGRAGLADLRGEIVLRWAYDERTQIQIGAHGSAMMDSELDRWFGEIAPQGVDDDPIWFTAGVNWVF